MGHIKEVIGPRLHLITVADVWRIDWRVQGCGLCISLRYSLSNSGKQLSIIHGEFEMSER